MQIDKTSRYSWVCLKTDFGFPPRDSGMPFDFNGRSWLSNGYQLGNVLVRDLLTSHDGIGWQSVNASTPYQGYSAVCPFNGWVYVYDGILRRTKDGVTFESVATTGNPAFEPEAPMVEIGGKLHIIQTGFIATLDPSTATFTKTAHPSLACKGQGRILFDGRIFIIGGAKTGANTPIENTVRYMDMTSLNEVWSTDDPEDPNAWVKHECPPFLQRMWPGLVAHAGHLYVCGGYSNFLAANLNDTWRTANGDAWEKVVCSTDYPARHAPTMYSRNGRLLMVCGNTNSGPSVQKDIWEMKPNA